MIIGVISYFPEVINHLNIQCVVISIVVIKSSARPQEIEVLA